MTRLPVANPWAEAPVLYKESTRSTMEDARALFEQGCPSGTVIVAGYQEKGRGRFPQRIWQAESGKSLLFTLLLAKEPSLPPQFPPQRLPVLAGLALSLALEQSFGLKTLVKWPNDLLCRGKKLAGMLCEALSFTGGRQWGQQGPVYLIGIGLNCNQRVFSEELAGTACSLAQVLGREVNTMELLEAILSSLHSSFGDARWREKLEERLYGLGQEIAIVQDAQAGSEAQIPGGQRQGVLQGIAADGALLLQVKGQPQPVPVYCGELRIPAHSST